MDGADRELLRESLRRAVADHTGPALDAALDEIGWRQALDTDAEAAVGELFTLQGSANATSQALAHVVGHALGLDGPETAAVLLPTLGRWHAPGELAEGELVVRGLGTGSPTQESGVLVVVSTEGWHDLVEVAPADLIRRDVHGIDPRLGLVEMAGERVPYGESRLLPPTVWREAVSAARLAVSHELLGAARSMLDLARNHALTRHQFGQPIGDFQAVRHRLADTLVALEAAEALLGAAWTHPSPEMTVMAKALAGRTAHTAARHCQQVLGGMGFTTEHELHRYVRRVFVLDQLFGSARALTRGYGAQLLSSAQLPAPPPL